MLEIAFCYVCFFIRKATAGVTQPVTGAPSAWFLAAFLGGWESTVCRAALGIQPAGAEGQYPGE